MNGVKEMIGKNFTSASKDDNVYTPFSMTEQLLENEEFDYNKSVLEPCCGKGHISLKLDKCFTNKNVSAFDIKEHVLNDFLIENRQKTHIQQYNYIITNPPYSKLDKFIVKAKEIATDKFAFLCKLTHLGGVQRFTSGIFQDESCPLTKIYLFTRQANLRFFDRELELSALNKRLNQEINKSEINRTMINHIEKEIEKTEKKIHYPEIRSDGKYPAGMYYYCWLIWENMNNKYKGINNFFKSPEFHWIDNNKYILSKKD